MSNKEKAIKLIHSFSTGDIAVAKDLLKENYIQHNLLYGTGSEAFVGSVSYLDAAPVKTTVKNIRAFEDGDKVFLHTVYISQEQGIRLLLIYSALRMVRLQNIGIILQK